MAYKDEWKINFSAIDLKKPDIAFHIQDWKDAINRVYGEPSELETREPYGKIVRGKNEMLDKIKNVIFNEPATIVFWDDGTKTVVKAEDEAFDPEKGLAMAIVKKTMADNHGYYNEIFKKWIPEKVKVESVTKVYSEGVQVGVFYRDFAPITKLSEPPTNIY